jgi:hypothetical protein
MGMDRELSDDLNGQCLLCGAVVGVVLLDILEALLGLECALATCPHCGRLNTFPGFAELTASSATSAAKRLRSQAAWSAWR